MKQLRWLLPLIALAACSTAKVKEQEYAKLPNSKVFEEEYPNVWKGILAAMSEYKLEEKDGEAGRLVTDWVYSTSNEKYVDYQINGQPRKHYLQSRYKFTVSADKQVGGVKVTVDAQQEVEDLKRDGTFEGWRSVSNPDTSRENELLHNIELKILSRPE